MKKIKLMEVCGTHTMAIAKSGIKELLPEDLELISGPGCPVCVTPQGEIDKMIALGGFRDSIAATFGDMMRVPGSIGSLQEAKRRGGNVKIVYSCLDALEIAEDNPEKKIIFIGVGFETTAPTAAMTILEAKKNNIKNFYVLSNFKTVFPALNALSENSKVKIDGFICPGHVSVITGAAPYKKFAAKYKKPCVITGFEPGDLIKGIELLIDMVLKKKYSVEIEYKRAVTDKGNIQAQRIMNEVFENIDSEWRGLGMIKKSGFGIREKYADFDARRVFLIDIPRRPAKTNKLCRCGEVLQGIITPEKCRLFRKVCTPINPVGPCMVSTEGTCAAHYRYM